MKNIKSAFIYVEGKGITKTSMTIKQGKIVAIGDEVEDGIVLDDSLIIIPGFINRHIHGVNNCDIMDAKEESVDNIAKTILKEGITSFLPTTMTQSLESIKSALGIVKNYHNKGSQGAEILGIHLEGPFISPKKRGAHLLEYIIPCNIEILKELNEVSGNLIKEVTYAPEENGVAFIEYLKNNHIIGSIGHTACTCQEALEAISLGASSLTHCYNAMSGIANRNPGALQASFIGEGINCEVIADLIHVDEYSLKLLYQNKGKENISLITDSIEASHLLDGIYKLGGQDVFVKEGSARLKDGVLAGSTLKMNIAVKNMRNVLGISLEEAVDMATISPAKTLGVDSKKGSIALNKDADFVIIDKDVNVFATVVKGEILFQEENFVL